MGKKIRTHSIRKAHENIDKTLKVAESILGQFDLARQVRLILGTSSVTFCFWCSVFGNFVAYSLWILLSLALRIHKVSLLYTCIHGSKTMQNKQYSIWGLLLLFQLVIRSCIFTWVLQLKFSLDFTDGGQNITRATWGFGKLSGSS